MVTRHKEPSGGPREDVRPEVLAGHPTTGGLLHRTPILGGQQVAAAQPVRDMLLADGPAHELSQASSQLGLAAGDAHGPSQGTNVRQIGSGRRRAHADGDYTNAVVPVNERDCVTAEKPRTKVTDIMSAPRRKLVSTPGSAASDVAKAKAHGSNKRVAKPGPDGKTLGQRVTEALAYAAGWKGEKYTQSELLADINRLVESADDDKPYITQQGISAVMRGLVSTSRYTPYIAQLCKVEFRWLDRGLGEMIPKNGGKSTRSSS